MGGASPRIAFIGGTPCAQVSRFALRGAVAVSSRRYVVGLEVGQSVDMKIAFLFVLALEAACLVQGQMNPLGSGLQRMLVGLFGARGGGRYGNPNAAYVQQGAIPHGNPSMGHAGYRTPMNGNARPRPMFNNGVLPFLGAGSLFRPLQSRRWRRQASYPEDLVSRGFYFVRRQDNDRCVMRASCEAAASPGEFGSEGEFAVQFILSLRHDGDASWQPYLLSARVGKAHGSLQLCRRIFRGCLLPKEQLRRTSRDRLIKALRCLSSQGC